MTSATLHATLQPIRLGSAVTVELLGEGGRFAGLGRIDHAGTPLRSGRRPMFVDLGTPDGVELVNYRLLDRRERDGGVDLEFDAQRREGGQMEWMLHTVRNRRNLADWTEPPRDAAGTTLALALRPVERRVGAWTARGFSYQYRYRSADLPLYRILDRGTWEPGGRAVGNAFWMRNCFTPTIVPIRDAAQFHSTEWYGPSCANASIFQFLPLQTELQGFTFTVNPTGVLVTWASRVAHIRSIFEKPRGKDELVHWHEHCGDLATEFATAPMEVLWFPGTFDQTACFNLYEAVKELVHETLHAELGMRRERVGAYSIIEEWGDADLVRYREQGLSKLIAAGVKKVGLANHFQNNMNTWGVGNMCCTVDYQVAESVGKDKLTAFCAAAREAGVKVEMWGNTSISSLTWKFSSRNGRSERIRFLPVEGSIMEALKKSKEPFVRNPSNAIEADHYTPDFCVLNLRDPVVREYWLRRWGEAHDQVGLEGFFLDSSFNLSSDKFHWRQNALSDQGGATADQTHLLGSYRPAVEPPSAILSQYRAHLELMTQMQRLGYEYCNEDLGVFGLHRHGPGIEARLDTLPLWTDCICNFNSAAIRKAGADPDDVFFRGLAYRMMWTICWDIGKDSLSFSYGGIRSDDDVPKDHHLALLRAYNEVADGMLERRILPSEQGVLYRGKDAAVLWAFADLVLPLSEPADVHDVLGGTVVTGARQVEARRHRVYRIDKEEECGQGSLRTHWVQ